MPRKKQGMLTNLKKFTDTQYKVFKRHFGPIVEIFEYPFLVLASPITFACNVAGSAPRGFGVPELISKLAYSGVFLVATMGTYDIVLDLGRKVICTRDCQTCSGWQALRCTMCKGSGKVQFQVKNYTLKRGEKATAESIADAISDNRAELVHLPSVMDLHFPLPSKECPSCDGSGVMKCPECKDKFPLRISADKIMEPPSKVFNIMKKMDYPYEHIVDSMKDPSIAAFWLFTLPQIMGGFEYDDEVKRKIWWHYKESMRYDHLRDIVAQRKPGWEYLQEALVSIDPIRAKEDPVVVKNIPIFKAKKALEAEVMKLDAPPRPRNWGDLNLPLDASSWSEEELKDPRKQHEMTVLLNAQREIAEKMLDAQWEAKWREMKLNKMLEEKVRPYIQNIDNTVLPQPIVIPPEKKRRRWWPF